MNLKEFDDVLYINFNDIKVEENETKGILSITFVKNNSTKKIDCSQYCNGNKLDLVEVLIMLLRDKKELEIQQIFEAVKEYI